MNNRYRSLLDLAHRVEQCTNCRRWTGGCEPAHENSIDAGKGFGIKAHDNRHAALCHDCHVWLDQGSASAVFDPSGRWPNVADGKHAMWVNAHLKTFDIYWRNGWLKVAA